MQDNKDYIELYYRFVSAHTVDLSKPIEASTTRIGDYRVIDRDGRVRASVPMLYEDMSFADRLYQLAKSAGESPGTSVLAACAKGPEEPPAPPAEPGREPETPDELAARIYELGKGMPTVDIMHYLRSKGTWEFHTMAGNLELLIDSVVDGLSKSVKYGYLFGIPGSRLKEIRARIAGDLMLTAADDFFGRVLPGVGTWWERKNPGKSWKMTPDDASRIAGRFLRGRIRNACIKYARAFLYTYGPNPDPDMTLPEDWRWAESHKVMPMLPAILLDIDNSVRFRVMVLRFGTTGNVTYSGLGMTPVVTEDLLESDYPAINRLCSLLVAEIVRGARAGDYFDPRDSDSWTDVKNDAKETELRDYSLRFLYRKLSGGLEQRDVSALREIVDAQMSARRRLGKSKDKPMLRRCTAMLRKLARNAVSRAMYELRKGGRKGADMELAKPLD